MEPNGNWQATEQGQAFQERLTDPDTLAVMNRLLDRIDSLERTVTKLTMAVEQAPGLAAIAVDVVDEELANAGNSGIDVEARLRGGLSMLIKLSSPETMHSLDQALELANRLPGTMSMVADMADESMANAQQKGIDVEQRLGAALSLAEKLTAPETMHGIEQLLQLSKQAPGLVSMAADMADEAMRNASDRGIDVEQRIGAALGLVEKLTAPETIEQLENALSLAQQGSGLAAIAADMFDEFAQRLMEKGIDLDTLFNKGLHAAHKGYDVIRSEEFDALMDSKMLQPDTIAMVSKAGEALVAAQQQPAQGVGPMGAFRKMSDPDVKRALGFMLAFAKNFGKQI